MIQSDRAPLRIVGAEIISTRIPTIRAHEMAIGTTRFQESVFVRLETDAGMSGLGEAPHMIGHSHAGETQASVALQLQQRLLPVVMGRDAMQINGIAKDLDKALPMNPRAKSAINIALYDLAGKWLDTPAYNLLGGIVRESIPLSWSIGMMPPEDAAAEAAIMVERGFRILKVKVGARPDWREDVAAVAAVRDAVGPAVRVRADANQGYDVMEAKAAIAAMAESGLESMEQPVPAWDLAGMADVLASSPCHIMADESVNSPREVLEVIKHRAADIVSIYINTGGGITAASAMADVAEVGGLIGYIGGALEGPAAARACLHLGASAPAITYGCETAAQFLLEADLSAEALVFEDGSLVVPSGPGLGAELDEDALREYEIARATVLPD